MWILLVRIRSPLEQEGDAGYFSKRVRPTIICISSGVFIGHDALNAIRLTDIAILNSGR